MVFVWSRLTGGDPLFTLSQVALNDSIMVIAFAPLVGLLLGMSAITVPWATLLTSVVLYIVIPVIMAQILRKRCSRRTGGIRRRDGEDRPVVDRRAAGHAGAAVRVPGRSDPEAAAGDRAARGADPDSGVLQLGARVLAQPRVGEKHNIACPSALIGASNFFELAVAAAISLFGFHPARHWLPSSAC
jgi:ACR3 family arsenite transporter